MMVDSLWVGVWADERRRGVVSSPAATATENDGCGSVGFEFGEELNGGAARFRRGWGGRQPEIDVSAAERRGRSEKLGSGRRSGCRSFGVSRRSVRVSSFRRYGAPAKTFLHVFRRP
ncbi:hypothetical protein OROGR_022004 [Orobanche gracilis]